MIQLDEQQRITAYRRGWNDAQHKRAARRDQPITYQIGYIESMKGSLNLFDVHESEVQ